MTTREITATLLAGLAFLIWLVTISQCVAAPYTSPPKSIDKIWWKTEGQYLAVVWQQTDNSYYCLAGDWMNAVNYYNSLPAFQDNESLPEYMMRARSQIAARDLQPEELALCQLLAEANRPSWVVEQYRTNPDRPVKRIIDVNGVPTVDTGDTIGRINYGEPCAEEIFSGTRYMWRRVTIIYPDGSPVDGAAVCESQ